MNSTTGDDRRYLSRGDAARYLGHSPRTLQNWAYKRVGPRYRKIGTTQQARCVYRIKDLDEWLEDNGCDGPDGEVDE